MALYATGSAIGIVPLPRQTTAFRRLLPITAPIPVRPTKSCLLLAMAAKRTRFSPAGPMERTLGRLPPVIVSRRRSVVS